MDNIDTIHRVMMNHGNAKPNGKRIIMLGIFSRIRNGNASRYAEQFRSAPKGGFKVVRIA